MQPSKVLRRLQRSLTDRRIATAVRQDFELTMVDGFVIALTNNWVVLHTLDSGVHLDEVVMLRLQDISTVLYRSDDAYHHRAVAALGEPLASFDCDDDAGAADLIKAAAQTGIFAVHFEILDGEPLCIGRLLTPRNKSFDMHYVGRDGVWAPDLERWKYRHVTRIEMGGRYLGALNRFADPQPDAGGRKIANLAHSSKCRVASCQYE